VQRSQLSKRLDDVRKSLSLAESSTVVGLDPNSCQVEVSRIASDESARYILIKSQGGGVDNVLSSDVTASDNVLMNVTESSREVNTVDDKLSDAISHNRISNKMVLDDSSNESSINDINDDVVDITGDKCSNRTCDMLRDKVDDIVGTTSIGGDRNAGKFNDSNVDILDMAAKEGDTNISKVNIDDDKLSITSGKDTSSNGVIIDDDKIDFVCSTSRDFTASKVETGSTNKDDIISDTVDQDSDKGEITISKVNTAVEKSGNTFDMDDTNAVCIEEIPEKPVCPLISTTGLTSSSVTTTSQPTTQSQNDVPYLNTTQNTSPLHLTKEVEIMSDDTDTNSGMSM